MADTTSADQDGFKTLHLDPEDRYKLMQLALDERIKRKRLELAHLEHEAAKALSDAAGDVAVARLGVPPGATEVTLDIISGTIKFRPPAE